MAFTAKDGSKHTNRDTMVQQDRKKMATMPDKQAPADPMGEPDGDEQDGEAVAAAHGPATEVHMMHQQGQHEVHSVHPDGHTHMSNHGSVEEAHEHGKKLAGAGQQEPQEPEGY